MAAIALVAGLIVILLIALLWISSRYKRCPSDRVLVIYGRVGGQGQSARCLHGGGALVWPVIQGYAFLDLTPLLLRSSSKAPCRSRTSGSTRRPRSQWESPPSLA